MTGYYAERLSGGRLRRCYEIAPPRVRQYLEAEIEHVRSRIKASDAVLELGCGYGRVALRLAESARRVVGIDTAGESLALARDLAGPASRCEFRTMDALRLDFPAGEFDAVVCVQNGICAFGVDPLALVREAIRVTRPGCMALFSTYSEAFWSHRLEWFEAQAAAGLIGPLDRAACRDGVIACTDGFRAGMLSPGELRALCAAAGVDAGIVEVDGSSVFCEILVAG